MGENEKMELSNYRVDYTGLMGDARLERRGEKLMNSLFRTPRSSISRISLNTSEQRAYYRFLNNEKVTETKLIAETTGRVGDLCTDRHVLCIQDTCEVNLGKHKGRLRPESGLGRSDNAESGDCFKLHPSLILDAESLTPLGYSAIKVFHRPYEMPDRKQRKYKSQPIEEKESYKWIEVAKDSKKALQQAAGITFIEDREGDIYEQFALIPDERTHLLVRSRTTRKLTNGNTLYKEVEAAPVAGTYTIELPTDKRKDRYKRNAEVELRFTTCSLQCPANLRNKGYPSSITVSCISAREIGTDIHNPINWKLLTTHKIETYDQALTMVWWYGARWYIEQLFRILKKQGFGIEETEIESGWAIRKLVIMQMTALLKILQMNIAYADPEGGQPIEEVFDKQQIEALHLLNNKLQGKTAKPEQSKEKQMGSVDNWASRWMESPPAGRAGIRFSGAA